MLAVRLHSTDSVLASIESRVTDIHALALYDLERKALADCDLIVAQLPGVARQMQLFYDFSDEEWLSRQVVHAPPVLIDSAAADRSVHPSLDTPIVFSSKIQRLKRPDVFVRGCSGFLRANPAYVGDIVVLAHAFDETYLAQVKALIPKDLGWRFRFVSGSVDKERTSTIARSVCVFPTIWESFCLAAYEASMLGAICLLNEENPSFDDQSPWIAGQNCEKFDGSAEGLTASLLRIFADPGFELSVVSVPDGESPWKRLSRGKNAHSDGSPLVSVVIPHYNLGVYLHRTIESVLASTYTNVEIVVVDDASTDVVSRSIIAKMSSLDDPRLRVIESAQNRGLAATRNIGIRECRGEFVLPLDADDLISSDFLETAVRGLVRNPAFDIVVPQTAYFDDNAEGSVYAERALAECYVFIGEARASGLHQNRFSTATMLVRRDLLLVMPYREEMYAYEDWDLYLRAVTSGRRILVTNSVQFFYRRRADSMIHSDHGRAMHRLAYHDVLRDKTFRVGQVTLPLFAIEGFSTEGGSHVGAGASSGELRARLEAFENSEVVFAALTIARQLQRRAPWLLRWGKSAMRALWRVAKRNR